MIIMMFDTWWWAAAGVPFALAVYMVAMLIVMSV
jgi:hypothetical protein